MAGQCNLSSCILVNAMPRTFLLIALFQLTPAWAANLVEESNPDGRPMRFQLYRPCGDQTFNCATRVLAQGRIEHATADALRDFLAQARLRTPDLPNEMMICFDSGRGEIEAAIRLGAMIRGLNMTTCVEARYEDHWVQGGPSPGHELRVLADEPLCTSVCVLALAGGTTRYVAEGAKLALRHFTELDADRDISDPPISTSALKNYLEESGIDPSLLDIAAITPRNEARFLSDDDVVFYRISTQGVESGLVQSR